MKQPEILAPAGGMEQLTAAVRCGADAVYLGARAFNARMGAENFDDLTRTVSYCHARGVRVYVTFNTLFTESETQKALETLQSIAASGADAVLAADMGSVRLIRRCCPALPNHRLDTMCQALHIPLDHHRADSDSMACAKLLLYYQQKGLRLSSFLREYDLKNLRTLRR